MVLFRCPVLFFFVPRLYISDIRINNRYLLHLYLTFYFILRLCNKCTISTLCFTRLQRSFQTHSCLKAIIIVLALPTYIYLYLRRWRTLVLRLSRSNYLRKLLRTFVLISQSMFSSGIGTKEKVTILYIPRAKRHRCSEVCYNGCKAYTPFIIPGRSLLDILLYVQ